MFLSVFKVRVVKGDLYSVVLSYSSIENITFLNLVFIWLNNYGITCNIITGVYSNGSKYWILAVAITNN
jgi:hypothetical protein